MSVSKENVNFEGRTEWVTYCGKMLKCSPACCIMLQSYSQLDCEPQDPIDVRVHVRRKNVYSTPESYGEKRQQ